MKRVLLLVVLAIVALQPTIAQSPQQAPPPTRILIAYYSETGNTEKLAQAIRDGAASVPGVEVTLQKVGEVKDDAIPSYDGIILGTPIHWGNLSTESKRFLDRVGMALWKAKTNGDGRTAGTFCTGGSVAAGKDLARLSIIASFLGMRYIIVGGVAPEGFGTLGPETTTMGPKPGVSEEAIKEGRTFGERFARVTKQLRAAR